MAAVWLLLKSSMRWLDFVGGALWASVLDRGTSPSNPVECHCRCECDIPLCPGISIWWEIIKIAVWVSVGIILQGLRGFSYLWQWQWPHVVSDPGLKGVVRDVEAREESVEEAVQELAQQQLQALRRRQASRQQ